MKSGAVLHIKKFSHDWQYSELQITELTADNLKFFVIICGILS